MKRSAPTEHTTRDQPGRLASACGEEQNAVGPRSAGYPSPGSKGEATEVSSRPSGTIVLATSAIVTATSTLA